MKIQSTRWFTLDQYAPVRDGWYEVRLVSGDTAFAKFGDGEWTEKPMLTFTRWQGLCSDPAKSSDQETIAVDATAAKGVRDAPSTSGEFASRCPIARCYKTEPFA